MQNMTVEEVYTGGGCDHYELHFKQYGIFFVINNNDCNIPVEGEDWGFCSYASEDDQNNGNFIDCVGVKNDGGFNKNNLIGFFNGYILAKGLKKIDGYFDIEDIDFDSLAFDIAQVCEPHVLYDALYFYLKTLTKEQLQIWLNEVDASQSFEINNYL